MEAGGEVGFSLVKDSETPNVVTVIGVEEDGVAYASGFRVGDRIRTIGGVPVDTTRTLDDIAMSIRSRGTDTISADAGVDASLEVEVGRDGLPKPLSLVLPGVAQSKASTQAAVEASGSPFVSISLVESLPLPAFQGGGGGGGGGAKGARASTSEADGGVPVPNALYIKLDDFGPRAIDELAATLGQFFDLEKPTASASPSAPRGTFMRQPNSPKTYERRLPHLIRHPSLSSFPFPPLRSRCGSGPAEQPRRSPRLGRWRRVPPTPAWVTSREH